VNYPETLSEEERKQPSSPAMVEDMKDGVRRLSVFLLRNFGNETHGLSVFDLTIVLLTELQVRRKESGSRDPLTGLLP
jgi:hypothetical protein